MRGKMTPLCRRHFEINFNEWKLLYFDLTFFRVCSTSTHELGYHVSRAVVTQAGQLWPIRPNLAESTPGMGLSLKMCNGNVCVV